MNRNCCPVLIDEVFRLKCEGNLICFSNGGWNKTTYSIATMKKNGAVLENEVPYRGKITQRYWIEQYSFGTDCF